MKEKRRLRRIKVGCKIRYAHSSSSSSSSSRTASSIIRDEYFSARSAECLVGIRCLYFKWCWDVWLCGTRQGYLAVGQEKTWKAKARIESRDHEEEDEMGEYSKGSFYRKYWMRKRFKGLFEDSSSEELELWLLEMF